MNSVAHRPVIFNSSNSAQNASASEGIGGNCSIAPNSNLYPYNFLRSQQQPAVAVNNQSAQPSRIAAPPAESYCSSPATSQFYSRDPASNYLNPSAKAQNDSVSQLPVFTEKSSGLTSPQGLMNFAGDRVGNDKMARTLEAARNRSTSSSAYFENGITARAISPSRQIMNPCPKSMNNQDYAEKSLNSITHPATNSYANSFADLSALRLKTYQQYNKPSRDDMKNDLVDSMATAKTGTGVGIIPGQNLPSVNAETSFPFDRGDFRKYSDIYTFSKGNASGNQSSKEWNNGNLSPTVLSRARDLIGKVKSEVEKTKGMISPLSQTNMHGKPSNDWCGGGVPQFEGRITDIYADRAKKSEYREALQLQIRQKQERKLLEQQKELEHPLGGGQTDSTLSFGAAAKLGQYPNLRQPRNNFSKFETSVIYESGIGPYDNKQKPGPSVSTDNNISPSTTQLRATEISQKRNSTQPWQVPRQIPSESMLGQRQVQFYPHQPPQMIPVPLQNPMGIYPYPMQMTSPAVPWQPMFPYPQPSPYHSQQAQQMRSFQNMNPNTVQMDNQYTNHIGQWNLQNQSEIINRSSSQHLPNASPFQSYCNSQNLNTDGNDNKKAFFEPNASSKGAIENESDEDILDAEFESRSKLKVWQTSDQLPDPALKRAFWKGELLRQIEKNRQQKLFDEAKVIEEEKMLEKKICDHIEAERRELYRENYTTEQRLLHKLKRRVDYSDFRQSNAGQKAQRSPRTRPIGNECTNPSEAVISDITPRKRSPPVPALQRKEYHNGYRTPNFDNKYNALNRTKSGQAWGSVSDSGFLHLIGKALETETQKQEMRLRKKLQRN